MKTWDTKVGKFPGKGVLRREADTVQSNSESVGRKKCTAVFQSELAEICKVRNVR